MGRRRWACPPVGGDWCRLTFAANHPLFAVGRFLFFTKFRAAAQLADDPPQIKPAHQRLATARRHIKKSQNPSRYCDGGGVSHFNFVGCSNLCTGVARRCIDCGELLYILSPFTTQFLSCSGIKGRSRYLLVANGN